MIKKNIMTNDFSYLILEIKYYEVYFIVKFNNHFILFGFFNEDFVLKDSYVFLILDLVLVI